MGTHPFTRRGRGSLHRICCQNDRECHGLSVGSTLRSLLRRWSVQEDSVERKATRASPRLQVHVDGGRPKADSRVVRCQLRLGGERTSIVLYVETSRYGSEGLANGAA